jgi:hypothetical protein
MFVLQFLGQLKMQPGQKNFFHILVRNQLFFNISLPLNIKKKIIYDFAKTYHFIIFSSPSPRGETPFRIQDYTSTMN